MGPAVGLSLCFVDVSLGLFSTALVLFLYWWVLVPTQYEVYEKKLIVRYGRMQASYPYEDIRTISPDKNLFSVDAVFLIGGAMSLDRLWVKPVSGRGIVISPVDKEAFYAAILKQTDRLERDGDQLVALDKP